MIRYYKVRSQLQGCDVMDTIYKVEGHNLDLFVRISLMQDVTEVSDDEYIMYLYNCERLRGHEGDPGVREEEI